MRPLEVLQLPQLSCADLSMHDYVGARTLIQWQQLPYAALGLETDNGRIARAVIKFDFFPFFMQLIQGENCRGARISKMSSSLRQKK